MTEVKLELKLDEHTFDVLEKVLNSETGSCKEGDLSIYHNLSEQQHELVLQYLNSLKEDRWSQEVTELYNSIIKREPFLQVWLNNLTIAYDYKEGWGLGEDTN